MHVRACSMHACVLYAHVHVWTEVYRAEADTEDLPSSLSTFAFGRESLTEPGAPCFSQAGPRALGSLWSLLSLSPPPRCVTDVCCHAKLSHGHQGSQLRPPCLHGMHTPHRGSLGPQLSVIVFPEAAFWVSAYLISTPNANSKQPLPSTGQGRLP